MTLLTKSVENIRKRNQKCCLLALDIAGAFDNASHPVILKQLRKIKCPPNTYSMVKDFLCKRTAHVMVGNTISSKRMPPRVGLRSDPMEYYNWRPHHPVLKCNKRQNSCVRRRHYDHPAGSLTTCYHKRTAKHTERGRQLV